ncbi:arginine decarboxylase-like [Olea europaea var. sylvestris]|uniref:arginine decarboxylase-like n=1 Tax=Olea europaea var. sylvestris TaxID=158386 RepID=UPI000C1CD78D|nr:arginine decarboxylase-like [Olea europaea var. sylvestris]
MGKGNRVLHGGDTKNDATSLARTIHDASLHLHRSILSECRSTTSSTTSEGVREASPIYCELIYLGTCMKVIDNGSGLGIDYDGSKSRNSEIFVGYSVEDYAYVVARAVKFVCERTAVKHPVICSESDRAIVSHHSVLVFQAISKSSAISTTIWRR